MLMLNDFNIEIVVKKVDLVIGVVLILGVKVFKFVKEYVIK